MGILSTLLSGGVMVGEICRGVLGNGASGFWDAETGVRMTDSKIVFDSVSFCESNASNGTNELVAFNTSTTSDKIVQFSNDEKGNSITYSLPKMKAVPIQTAIQQAPSPDSMVNICTYKDNSSLQAVNNDTTPGLTFRFNNLKVGTGGKGEFITIYGFQISATKNSIVISYPYPVQKLTFLDVNTEKGINLVINQPVLPKPQSATNGEYKNYVFEIPFSSYSIIENDVLSGQLSFALSSLNTAQLLSNVNTESARDFHPAEEKYFRQLGILQ